MILLLAVLAGLLVGLVRASLDGNRYKLPSLKYMWMVFFALFLQSLVFYLPPTRIRIPDNYVPVFLVSSLLLLLIFVGLNRRRSGFLLLSIGLLLNLIVITMNRGMMPISPQTAERLAPLSAGFHWESGERFGWSKDIVIETDETKLKQLSDWILSPNWLSVRYAFSPGDVLIALGAFWFLWKYELDYHKAVETLFMKEMRGKIL